MSRKKFGKEDTMYQKYAELRDKNGVTDYRVATETGITKSTFTDWKNGKSSPKLEKLMKIAKFFNVPVEWFYSS